MTNFKEQQLNSQLREITEFKKNVQQMSICDCVNKAPQILQEAELLKLTQVEDLKQIEDPDYAYGEFVFENYLARHKNLPDG